MTDAILMRVYMNESYKYEGRPLHEVVVERASEFGLSGATVLRGVLGYGANHHFHSDKILSLSNDLPLVVEIIDTEERLGAFAIMLQDIMDQGLVTTEKIRAMWPGRI